MASGSLYRLSAFTADPAGGNPAGVWVGPELPDPETMQRIARDVGYSETAFLAPARGLERTVRYYSPEAEVSFCGHATIASGVLLGELDGDGRYRFATKVGRVVVDVNVRDGHREAALTSVEPRHEPAPPDLIRDALRLLGWSHHDLDPAIPAAVVSGCRYLLTEDLEDGQVVDALTIVSPFTHGPDPLLP